MTYAFDVEQCILDISYEMGDMAKKLRNASWERQETPLCRQFSCQHTSQEKQ